MTSKAQEWQDKTADKLRVDSHLSIRGKTFVLTGKMWSTRGDIAHQIVSLGGEMAPRISFGVDYLVQADNEWGRPTTKRQTAERCGTKVISEKSLRMALRGQAPIA